MKVTFASNSFEKLKSPVAVCFATGDKKPNTALLRQIDKATNGALSLMYKSGEFSGSVGETASLTSPSGFQCDRILVVGIGDKKALDADCFRRAIGILSRNKALTQARKASFFFDDINDATMFQASIEGYILGSFKHLDYKTGDSKKDDRKLAHLEFVLPVKTGMATLKKAVERGQIIAEGQILTRLLAATPSADLTPRIYAKKVQALGKQHGFQVQILDERAIKREKMGALLGVAVGSEEPPRFIIMKYNGGKAGQKPVVLVGKGVTFDSGGISLKPGLNMHEMKQDMAGSAAVVAAMDTVARLKLPINLVALVPSTENMPSGKATKPGDILKSRNGKTIEIINTDAEGRLILADALDYANKFKPEAVIDIATLTGASLFILGYAGAPIMGNSEKLLGRIEDAADNTAEKVWSLPIWDEFRDQMKSPIADLVNSGGRPAGTIAAAAFLENFVGDWPWAHIDIAYCDLEPKGKAYVPAGATGFGLRLLVDVLSNWKKM